MPEAAGALVLDGVTLARKNSLARFAIYLL